MIEVDYNRPYNEANKHVHLVSRLFYKGKKCQIAPLHVGYIWSLGGSTVPSIHHV